MGQKQREYKMLQQRLFRRSFQSIGLGLSQPQNPAARGLYSSALKMTNMLRSTLVFYNIHYRRGPQIWFAHEVMRGDGQVCRASPAKKCESEHGKQVAAQRVECEEKRAHVTCMLHFTLC